MKSGEHKIPDRANVPSNLFNHVSSNLLCINGDIGLLDEKYSDRVQPTHSILSECIEECHDISRYKQDVVKLYTTNILIMITGGILNAQESFFRCATKFGIAFPNVNYISREQVYLVKAIEYFHNQQFNQGLAIIKEKADSGYSNAIVNYGYCCEYGIGINKNSALAFSCYKKGADLGNSDAMHMLGDCYQNAIGTAENKDLAFRLYKQSARLDNGSGMNKLAICYRDRIGTRRDKQKTYYWCKKGARLRNNAAMNSFGSCYQHAFGTQKNLKEAYYWHEQSVNSGSFDGIVNYAFDYEYGIGTLENKELAFYWYMISAYLGNSNGMLYVSYCNLNGKGTPKNEIAALDWLKESAAHGNATAMAKLATHCYKTGDKERAFYWYEKAIDLKNTRAMVNLGILYLERGTEKDREMAFYLFKEAASLGNIVAISNLCCCYKDGIGTRINIEQSFAYAAMYHNINNNVEGLKCILLNIILSQNTNMQKPVFDQFAIEFGSLPQHLIDAFPSDNISLEKLENNDLVYVLKSPENGKVNCITTVESLLHWLAINYENPMSREPILFFSNQQFT